MTIIPYPRPLRGPMREISDRLERGMLSAASAKEMRALGLDWQTIASNVHDMDWWRDQKLNICAPAKQHWNFNAWDATLRLATSEIILWIDPGPSAPLPSTPPDIVIITHAHTDHTERLQEWVHNFPEARILMTPLTAQLLSLRFNESAEFQKILDRTIQIEYNKKRTISGVTVQFLPAGHLLGAAMLEFEFGTDRILVTGDFALREVGGLPGAKIPEGEYAFVFMEATECSRKSLPYADLQSTRIPFLREVMEKILTNQSIVQVNTQSFGQAQEAYAALVMAQRAGAFPDFSVCLDGLAVSVSRLYEKQFEHQAGPWDIPFLKSTDSSLHNRLVITSMQSQVKSKGDVALIERPQLYTHAGWAEKMAFAVNISCDQIHYYHGFSNSLDVALKEIGRKTSSLKKDITL